MPQFTLIATADFTADGHRFTAGETVAVIDSPVAPGTVCSAIMARHMVSIASDGDDGDDGGTDASADAATPPAQSVTELPHTPGTVTDLPEGYAVAQADADPDNRELSDLTTARRADTLADVDVFTVGDLREWIIDPANVLEDLPGFSRTDAAALRRLIE